MRSIVIDGHPTRLLEAGSGSPVVVLHGWGGRIESMDPVVRCLAAAFRVIAADLPGFGESPPPPTTWGTPDYSAFIAGVLRELEVERAHFVGHSFGAKTALHLAAERPDLVDKLVLSGSPGIRRPPSLKARGKRALSKTARIAGQLGPPGRLARDIVYRRIASQDYRDAGAMRPVLVRVVNEDLASLLPAIEASTLLVWGGEDDAVPVGHARAMAKAIPDAGLVVFEGRGHFAYLDEPDRFCRVVRHFLGRPV